MRALTLAADLVSVVVLLTTLPGIRAVTQEDNLAIQRDPSPDVDPQKINYELFDDPQHGPSGGYNYHTPTYGGYGSPPPPPFTSKASPSGSIPPSLSTSSPSMLGLINFQSRGGIREISEPTLSSTGTEESNSPTTSAGSPTSFIPIGPSSSSSGFLNTTVSSTTSSTSAGGGPGGQGIPPTSGQTSPSTISNGANSGGQTTIPGTSTEEVVTTIILSSGISVTMTIIKNGTTFGTSSTAAVTGSAPNIPTQPSNGLSSSVESPKPTGISTPGLESTQSAILSGSATISSNTSLLASMSLTVTSGLSSPSTGESSAPFPLSNSSSNANPTGPTASESSLQPIPMSSGTLVTRSGITQLSSTVGSTSFLSNGTSSRAGPSGQGIPSATESTETVSSGEASRSTVSGTPGSSTPPFPVLNATSSQGSTTGSLGFSISNSSPITTLFPTTGSISSSFTTSVSSMELSSVVASGTLTESEISSALVPPFPLSNSSTNVITGSPSQTITSIGTGPENTGQPPSTSLGSQTQSTLSETSRAPGPNSSPAPFPFSNSTTGTIQGTVVSSPGTGHPTGTGTMTSLVSSSTTSNLTSPLTPTLRSTILSASESSQGTGPGGQGISITPSVQANITTSSFHSTNLTVGTGTVTGSGSPTSGNPTITTSVATKSAPFPLTNSSIITGRPTGGSLSFSGTAQPSSLLSVSSVISSVFESSLSSEVASFGFSSTFPPFPTTNSTGSPLGPTGTAFSSITSGIPVSTIRFTTSIPSSRAPFPFSNSTGGPNGQTVPPTGTGTSARTVPGETSSEFSKSGSTASQSPPFPRPNSTTSVTVPTTGAISSLLSTALSTQEPTASPSSNQTAQVSSTGYVPPSGSQTIPFPITNSTLSTTGPIGVSNTGTFIPPTNPVNSSSTLTLISTGYPSGGPTGQSIGISSPSAPFPFSNATIPTPGSTGSQAPTATSPVSLSSTPVPTGSAANSTVLSESSTVKYSSITGIIPSTGSNSASTQIPSSQVPFPMPNSTNVTNNPTGPLGFSTGFQSLSSSSLSGPVGSSNTARSLTVTPFTTKSSTGLNSQSVPTASGLIPPFSLSNITESLGPTVSPNKPSGQPGGSVGLNSSSIVTTSTESISSTLSPGSVLPTTTGSLVAGTTLSTITSAPPFPLTNSTMLPNPTAPSSGIGNTVTEPFPVPSSIESNSAFGSPPGTSQTSSTVTNQPVTGSESAFGSTPSAPSTSAVGIPNSITFSLSNSSTSHRFSTSGPTGQSLGPSTQSTFQITVSLSTGLPNPTSQSSLPTSISSSLSNNTLPFGPTTSLLLSSSGASGAPLSGITTSVTSPSGSLSRPATANSSITSVFSNSSISISPPLGASTTGTTAPGGPSGQGTAPQITSSSTLSSSETCTEELPTSQEPDTTCTESETPTAAIDTTCTEDGFTEPGPVATLTSSAISFSSGAEGATGMPGSWSSSTTSCTASSFSNTTLFGTDHPTTFQTSTIVSISSQVSNSSVIVVGSASENATPIATSSSIAIIPLPTPDRDHWHTPPAGPTSISAAARDTKHGDEGFGWRHYARDLFSKGNHSKDKANKFEDEEKA
ncbi:hypothetical protein Daesc_001732 [Daldinia eschscholtzii]|uniref:Uncharacterized protein n=1 Tax=Daldinia eschscholtzii TaxID=292717 RepID=A0AAX6MVD3_9PEZI